MTYGFSCAVWGAAEGAVAGPASPRSGMRVNDVIEQASTNNAVTGTDQRIELSLGAFISSSRFVDERNPYTLRNNFKPASWPITFACAICGAAMLRGRRRLAQVECRL